MSRSRVLSASLIASALVLAPMSSALAGGGPWSHGRAPAYHGGYHGAHWHGGGGYWRGGIWWPAAAAAAVVGTAAALVRRLSWRSATRLPTRRTSRRRAPRLTTRRRSTTRQGIQRAAAVLRAVLRQRAAVRFLGAGGLLPAACVCRAAAGLLRTPDDVRRADLLSAAEQHLLSSARRGTGVLHLLPPLSDAARFLSRARPPATSARADTVSASSASGIRDGLRRNAAGAPGRASTARNLRAARRADPRRGDGSSKTKLNRAATTWQVLLGCLVLE